MIAILLMLAGLLPAQQGMAQHGHRHRHTAPSTDRLPDSISTEEEEKKPFSSNDEPAPPAPSSNEQTQTVKIDTATTYAETDTTSSGSSTAPASEDSVAEEPVVMRAIPDSVVDQLKRSRDFAYANDPDYWKREVKKEESNSFSDWLARVFSSDGFRYSLYAIAAIALLFALYRIISDNNLRFFYRSPVRAEETLEDEALLPEESLDERLEKALAEKDYRLATRYLYLKSLRHLEKKQLIQLHAQTTDEAYVRQMGHHPGGPQFQWLASIYERVWYGGVVPDEAQFNKVQDYFNSFYTFIQQQKAS